VPILFKFFRDLQDDVDDDGDHIWFNIQIQIDPLICDQQELMRFKSDEYLQLYGYNTSNLYQGEDEEQFLINQHLEKHKQEEKRKCLKSVRNFIDIYILGNKEKIKSKVEVNYSYINFQPYILQDKLEKLRECKTEEGVYKVNDESKMNMFKLSNFTQQMINLTNGEIRSQQMMR